MVKLNQGWLDIEAMPEDIFWAYAAMADELLKQEHKATAKMKSKSRRG